MHICLPIQVAIFMYVYEYACVYMHFLSCFYTKLNLSISLFSDSFSDSEKPGSHSPQHICSFVQCKDAPRVLPFFPLLSSSLLCFLRHRMHHCPTECDIPSLPCTHQIPLPLPTHLLRHCYLSPGWKGAGRWEMKGREDHYAFPLMDGFESLPNIFHNTHAFVFNEQIFLLYPLTFLYSLSITYFSPRLLSQLGIKLLPWRK